MEGATNPRCSKRTPVTPTRATTLQYIELHQKTVGVFSRFSLLWQKFSLAICGQGMLKATALSGIRMPDELERAEPRSREANYESQSVGKKDVRKVQSHSSSRDRAHHL